MTHTVFCASFAATYPDWCLRQSAAACLPPTAAQPESDSDSGGAITGIVVGCLFVVLFIVVAAVVVLKRRSGRDQPDDKVPMVAVANEAYEEQAGGQPEDDSYLDVEAVAPATPPTAAGEVEC
jgi:heme/copper-type cytochrome/quinol oxidase subunit 2